MGHDREGEGAARKPALQDQNGRSETDCLIAEQTGRGRLLALGKETAVWQFGITAVRGGPGAVWAMHLPPTGCAGDGGNQAGENRQCARAWTV